MRCEIDVFVVQALVAFKIPNTVNRGRISVCWPSMHVPWKTDFVLDVWKKCKDDRVKSVFVLTRLACGEYFCAPTGPD